MIWIGSIAVEQGGYTLQQAFSEVPLRVVFALEHSYHIKNGRKCRVLAFEESLELLLKEL